MPARTPLHPQVFGRIEREGYTVEKVLLETLPGYYLGGNLYRPRTAGKHPGIVSPHGHWSGGRLEDSEKVSVPGRAINFARQGYVVFTYDMVGYNDTTQTGHGFAGKSEDLWRFLPLSLQLWNSLRATDFVASLPDVDPARLAMTGASGGGTQTFLLTAIDPRIRFSAPVNMISAIMQGGDLCENMPGLRIGTFNVEIGAMMAPRPMLMVSATGDWTRNTLQEEGPAVRRIYELYGKASNLEVVQVDAKHNYNRQSREHVYRFFARQIKGDPNMAAYAEQPFTVEKKQDLLATHNHPLPAGALKYDQIFAQWRDMATRQMASLRNQAGLRQAFTYGISVEWPASVLSSVQGDAVALSRAGRGDRIPGLYFPGRRGMPVLVVDPKGAAAARKRPEVERYIAAGRPVLLIDAFQTGSAVAPRDRSTDHFLTFNNSDDTNRVQDVATAIAFLSGAKRRRVEVLGFDNAALWCMFGGAAAPVPVRVTGRLPDGFTGADNDYIHHFFVPGAQRVGGLATARRLARLKP
jgi:dienelactone hydrolase